MLEVIKIKNLAVIDQAEIPFREGLNILSGETGAGKSIILEAISLILGGRASADLVRTGCDEALVEGLFNIESLKEIQDRASRLGYGPDPRELLIKRSVSRTGRHRIHINGELATLQILQELCEGLIDLCGQHEHQSLLKPLMQLDLLDRYGSTQSDAILLQKGLREIAALQREFAELRKLEDERAKRLDFLNFQIEELRAAALEPGEDGRLQSEKKLLQSSEQRLQLAEASRQAFEGGDSTFGVLADLRGMLSKLRLLRQVDESVQPILDSAEKSLIEAEETSSALTRYLQMSSTEPGRLESVQERLARIAELRRKYGTSVDEMIATLGALEKELASLAGIETQLEDLQKRVGTLTQTALQKGLKLSKSRKKSAKLFSDSITGELHDLKMEDAVFEVELEEVAEVEQWSPNFGANRIEYKVRTNRGEEKKSLAKIASGGELSRIMLAVRRVISDRGGIGVYLFDEIDAGMGGQTAFKVGKKLKSVAQFNQVICITHLPQVAAFADHHLIVQKRSQGSRTITEIVELDSGHRQKELARMLGGEKVTPSSLQNAKDLIKLAVL